MIEEKKSKKGIGVIIVLVLCVLGLVGYILVDKKIIPLGEEVKKESSKITAKEKEKEQTEEVETLDSDNANVLALFDSVHFAVSGGIDSHLYKDGGYQVSTLSTEDKFKLAANGFRKDITSNPSGVAEVKEEVVKDSYEEIFGPGSYQQSSKISDGCNEFQYDASNKKYVANQYGCGGTSDFSNYEKLIEVKRYSNRIEMISANFYMYSDNAIYKDYNKMTKLGEIPWDFANTTELQLAQAKNQYIEENKDKLEQYTYIFKLHKDGFLLF